MSVAFLLTALVTLCGQTSFAEPINEDALYYYRAEITDVYDGDTVSVNIDLGFSTWLHDQKLRLFGINAPEVKGDEKDRGIKSREFLRAKLLGKTIILQSIRDTKEKYGRYLAVIWLDGVNVNELLVSSGYAVHQEY